MQQSKSEFEDVRQSILAKLKHAEVEVDVVTMPDFFLDHSLACDFDARVLARRITSVALKGGGEISDVRQGLEVGGNAAICTLALARLGATVHPMMKTDPLGLSLLRHFYEPARIDLNRIKLTGSLLPTLILELRGARGSANIMLGDSSHVKPFRFEDLDSEDLATIDRARYVCVFNWLYNKMGTVLAEKVFGYCRTSSKGRTFFDAADPAPRFRELPDLERRVLRKGLIDFWGVNENEVFVFAKLYKRKLKGRESQAPIEAAKVLSANTGARIYLHTAEYSASVKDDQVALVPAFAVVQRRGTGAGDSWNAGIMVANALGLTEDESLFFANAVAGRYVSHSQRVYSTVEDMASFLQNSALRLKRIRHVQKLSGN